MGLIDAFLNFLGDGPTQKKYENERGSGSFGQSDSYPTETQESIEQWKRDNANE